jgi:FdhE protein
VADSFRVKWWGGSRQAEPALASAIARLERLAEERPELNGPAGWLRQRLPDLAAQEKVSGESLSAETVRATLAQGIGVLRGQRLQFDAHGFRRRWQRALETLPNPLGDQSTARIAHVFRSKKLAPCEIVDALLAGGAEHLRVRMADLDLDPGAMATALRAASFPLLVCLRDQWQTILTETTWERGQCPLCGNLPLLGEFRGLEQDRILRCGWCAACWQVPRLFCPYCGTRDHQRLGLLHRDGEQNHRRASVCEACGHYVKMISTLAELPPLELWVADLETIHLDLAAAERGLVN